MQLMSCYRAVRPTRRRGPLWRLHHGVEQLTMLLGRLIVLGCILGIPLVAGRR